MYVCVYVRVYVYLHMQSHATHTHTYTHTHTGRHDDLDICGPPLSIDEGLIAIQTH